MRHSSGGIEESLMRGTFITVWAELRKEARKMLKRPGLVTAGSLYSPLNLKSKGQERLLRPREPQRNWERLACRRQWPSDEK